MRLSSLKLLATERLVLPGSRRLRAGAGRKGGTMSSTVPHRSARHLPAQPAGDEPTWLYLPMIQATVLALTVPPLRRLPSWSVRPRFTAMRGRRTAFTAFPCVYAMAPNVDACHVHLAHGERTHFRHTPVVLSRHFSPTLKKSSIATLDPPASACRPARRRPKDSPPFPSSPRPPAPAKSPAASPSFPGCLPPKHALSRRNREMCLNGRDMRRFRIRERHPNLSGG